MNEERIRQQKKHVSFAIKQMKIFEKYSGLPIQAKASLWYTICNFFQKGISIIAVPLYVKMLTSDEYGQWSVFQSWRDILIIFATLNLYAGVFTKALIDKTEERDKYTSSMQALGTLVTFVLFSIYYLTHDWCNKQIGLSTPYMLLLFLSFIVYPAFLFWTTRQRVEYKYRSMAAVTIIIAILTPAISIVLLKTTELRTNALILGYLIVQCSVGVVFYIYQYLKGKCFYNKEYWHNAIKFNVPLIPHYLSLIVLNQSDRIMIQKFCGDSDAGIYSLGYQIASAINVLISAINGSRVPWTYTNLKVRIYDRLKVITNVLVIMMSIIVFFVSLLAPEIIMILGTSEYSMAAYVIPVVTLGVFYTFIYDMYASIEFYFGATKYVMVASIIGASLNVFLNWIFIPQFGFIAAAYTTLVCYAVFMLMHYLFSRKVLHEQNINVAVYENNVVFLICAIITGISLGCMLLFNNLALRIILASLIVMICIIKRKKVMRLLMEIKK